MEPIVPNVCDRRRGVWVYPRTPVPAFAVDEEKMSGLSYAEQSGGGESAHTCRSGTSWMCLSTRG